MTYKFPHTIENCVGEKITFQKMDPSTGSVLVDAYCKPGAGPAMHTHLRQDEELTVVSGKMGYQVLGGEIKFALPGQTVLFPKKTPHKFWAEGKEDLCLHGRIQPADNVVFFLATLYDAQNKSGKAAPDPFTGAYLLTRYKKEYDMPEIPKFVKNIIFPITVLIGKLTGKYKLLKNAPAPLK